MTFLADGAPVTRQTTVLSQNEADILLETLIDQFSRDVTKNLPDVTLKPCQKAALISFAYNEGLSDLMAEDTLNTTGNTTAPVQATGETIAAGLVSLIQTAAGTHTSPTFSHILSITGEVLGIVADELETSLREKLDVNALNNGLQTVINGSQQVKIGLQNVRNVLNQRKTDETSPAHAA